MTNKTINGVPRDLLERLDFGKDTKCALAALPELRALLAAPDPIVEAEGVGEPVAWMNVGSGDVTTCPVVVMDWDDENEQVKSLYSADQLAALRSTISQLRNDLDGTRLLAAVQLLRIDQNAATIAQLKAENERLRADADQNVEWEETFGPDYTGDAGISASVKLPARNDASKNLDLEQCGYVDGWNACLDEVRRMNP